MRFTIGDGRREIAVADQRQPAVEPTLQVGLPFVAIRDVEQLHDIRTVVALALQRPRDLFADRRAVVGKRHEARLAALLLQPIAEHFRLRLLAALI